MKSITLKIRRFFARILYNILFNDPENDFAWCKTLGPETMPNDCETVEALYRNHGYMVISAYYSHHNEHWVAVSDASPTEEREWPISADIIAWRPKSIFTIAAKRTGGGTPPDSNQSNQDACTQNATTSIFLANIN